MQFTSDMQQALTEANLDMFIANVKCVVGQEIKLNNVLAIKPINSEYILNDTGNTAGDLLTNTVWKFNISTDKKMGTLTADQKVLDGYIVFNFSTKKVTITPPPDGNIKKGVNNVYLLDTPTARQVMNKRFIQIKAGGEGVDYAETIIGLINIPFAIDSKYKTGQQKIMLADFDTQLTGIELNTDTIIVNMGSISIPRLNNDFTDYEKTEVNLFLPFCDSVTLKSNDVVGYNVNIYYWVNCYNGETLINIYSGKNNALIESKKVDLKVNVPFNKIGSTPSNNAFTQIQSTGYNGVNTPYIELKTLDNVLKNGLFTNPVIDEKTLIDEKGFIEVENIELSVNATLQEKSEILNLLRQGVIIK